MGDITPLSTSKNLSGGRGLIPVVCCVVLVNSTKGRNQQNDNRSKLKFWQSPDIQNWESFRERQDVAVSFEGAGR